MPAPRRAPTKQRLPRGRLGTRLLRPVVAAPEAQAGTLVCWYDAQKQTGYAQGNAVSSLTNFGGTAGALTQGTGTNQPSWQDSAINGHPAVRFVTNDWMQTAAFGAAVAQPTTVVLVTRFAGASLDGQQILFDGQGGGSTNRNIVQIQDATWTTANWRIWAGAFADSASLTFDTSPHIVRALLNGASSKLWVDDTLVITGLSPGTNPLGGITLGSWADNPTTSFFNGDHGEVLAYQGDISASWATLRDYLVTKWDLGAATPISLADAGSAAETLTVAATVPLAEAGSGADTVGVAAAVPLAEAGAAADAVAVVVPIALAETGAGSEAVAVSAALPLAEAGVGTEALGVAATIPLAEVGAAAETLQVASPIALADTGAGAEVLQATAAVPLPETGAAAEILTVAAVVSLAETGTGSDQLTIPKDLVDAGAGADQLVVAAAVPLADTGTGVDTLAVAQTRALAETGTAADALAVAQTRALGDAGAATDALSVAAAIPLAETGTAAESAIAAVLAALAETGTGADSLTVFIPPPVPPPRWVEGASAASGTVEGSGSGSRQVEGVLVGAGVVEGSASV